MAVDLNDMRVLLTVAGIYVLSGCTQPLLMSLLKAAGIADQKSQLYMLFYYLGPSLVVLPSVLPFLSASASSSSGEKSKNSPPTTPLPSSLEESPLRQQHQHQSKNVGNDGEKEEEHSWRHVSKTTYAKAVSIATLDLIAQTLNYTGAGLSGPTIFAIVYSSVTIWTAVFSIFILYRELNKIQWIGVFFVFFGLVITATDSISLGPKVFQGTIYVFFGSILHSLVYVLNEYIMKPKRIIKSKKDDLTTEVYNCNKSDYLSVNMNCSIQAGVAFIGSLMWQISYTSHHFTESIWIPMQEAGTSLKRGIILLCLFCLSNLVHALCYFHCLQKLPGGAASAGVLKGLQAVLVFFATSVFFCGRLGGEEMCFTQIKLVSFLVVFTGVVLFGKGTEMNKSEYQLLQQKNEGGDDESENESKIPLTRIDSSNQPILEKYGAAPNII